MKLSFVETMHGTLKDDEGREHPIAFDVSATGRGSGHFELQGLLTAPSFGPQTPVEGTLTIAALPPSITYRLHFTAKGGQTLTLDAQKKPSPFSPVRSMTLMPTSLTDAAGRVVARGEMTFDLKDLLPFVRSWLPVRQTQQKQLDARRRAVARAFLKDRAT